MRSEFPCSRKQIMHPFALIDQADERDVLRARFETKHIYGLRLGHRRGRIDRIGQQVGDASEPSAVPVHHLEGMGHNVVDTGPRPVR